MGMGISFYGDAHHHHSHHHPPSMLRKVYTPPNMRTPQLSFFSTLRARSPARPSYSRFHCTGRLPSRCRGEFQFFFFLKKKSCPNQPMGAMALARGAMLPPALVRCGAARPFCRFERRLDQVVESQCLFFLLLSFSLAQVNSVAAARAWRFE